jgi:hypothetical protein
MLRSDAATIMVVVQLDGKHWPKRGVHNEISLIDPLHTQSM